MNQLLTEQKTEDLYELMLKPNDSYNGDAQFFVAFLRSNKLGITLQGLQQYVEFLNRITEGKKLSASTYNKRLQGAKKRLRYLFANSQDFFDVLKQYKFEEALKSIKPQKINSVAVSDENILAGEEVEKIIFESEDKTASILVEFLYATGLRISEALSILNSNIDLNNGKYIITVLGKGAKERKIFVAVSLIRKLRSYFQGSNYLFEHRGKPYNRISMTNRIAVQGKIILGRKISAHTLRHSFATATLERTGNLKGVSKYLGHSSVSTTANLYIHSELRWEDLSS